MSLGRNEKLHPACNYEGRELDCPMQCSKCAIAIKAEGDKALPTGQWDEALKQYKRALFVNPKFAEAWVGLGSIYSVKSEYNNALPAFEKALAIDPQYGRAMFGIANTLYNLGRYDEAMKMVVETLSLYGDDKSALKLKNKLIKAGVSVPSGASAIPKSTNSEAIYAVFEYYGDGVMCPKNFLCFKYGKPKEILHWLLNDGYLLEIYRYGQFMAMPSDKQYLDQIAKLSKLSAVTADTIASIDLRMPSCCTCRAVSMDISDMPAFISTVKNLISNASKIDTVAKDTDLNTFISALERADKSRQDYAAFAQYLPERYL